MPGKTCAAFTSFAAAELILEVENDKVIKLLFFLTSTMIKMKKKALQTVYKYNAILENLKLILNGV